MEYIMIIRATGRYPSAESLTHPLGRYDAASATLLARVPFPLSGGRTLDCMIRILACAIWMERVIRIEAAAALIAFYRIKTEDQVALRWH